jgi:hypothetical protein
MVDGIKTTLATVVAAAVAIQCAGQSTRPRPTPIETYEAADIDADGNLRIVTVERRIITVAKQSPPPDDADPRHTRFEDPVVSPDHRAVGAQAMFTNCCTSYDIPLQLVVYSQGTTHRFQGNLAIFKWHFADGGRRVVFSQETVHFSCSVHWELRDIATERLMAQADIPEPCGQNPDPKPVKVPGWVNGSDSGIN